MMVNYGFFSGMLGLSRGLRYGEKYSLMNLWGLFVYRKRVLINWHYFFFQLTTLISVWRLLIQGYGKILVVSPYRVYPQSRGFAVDSLYWVTKEFHGWLTNNTERFRRAAGGFTTNSLFAYDGINIFSDAFWQMNNGGQLRRWQSVVMGVVSDRADLQQTALFDVLMPSSSSLLNDNVGYFYFRFFSQIIALYVQRRYVVASSLSWKIIAQRLYNAHRFFFLGRDLFTNPLFKKLTKTLSYRSRWKLTGWRPDFRLLTLRQEKLLYRMRFGLRKPFSVVRARLRNFSSRYVSRIAYMGLIRRMAGVTAWRRKMAIPVYSRLGDIFPQCRKAKAWWM